MGMSCGPMARRNFSPRGMANTVELLTTIPNHSLSINHHAHEYLAIVEGPGKGTTPEIRVKNPAWAIIHRRGREAVYPTGFMGQRTMFQIHSPSPFISNRNELVNLGIYLVHCVFAEAHIASPLLAPWGTVRPRPVALAW